MITKKFLIEEYINKKKSWRQIAKELNVSDVLLLHHASKYGIQSRTISESRLLINNLDPEQITSDYDSGLSLNTIAEKYEVSYSAVRNVIVSSGAVLRNPALARSIKNDCVNRWLWERKTWLSEAYALSSINIISRHVNWSYGRIRKSIFEFNIPFKENKGSVSIIDNVLPEFYPINYEEFENDSAHMDIDNLATKYDLLKYGVIALQTHLKIKNRNNCDKKTNPSFNSLSEASKKKWQNDSFRNNVSINNSKKYDDLEYAAHMATMRSKQRTQVSSIQQKLYNILNELNVYFIKESSETIFGHYSFDCLIKNYYNDMSLLIEVQGDYWHSLDKVKNNDKRKFLFINKYFPKHRIIYLWEHEFENPNFVKNKLSAILGLIKPFDYPFEDLNVSQINYDQAKKILDSYHYLGSARGGVAFGALINDDVAICALFSSLVRQNIFRDKKAVELSRVCVNPSYYKKNLVSWFVSRVIKLVDCDIIISYSDSTVGHDGTIYKALNFKLDHIVEPDYWYVGVDNKILHKKTLYNRAKAIGLTESDYAFENHYYKQYGGQKKCFVYNKNK